MFFCSISILGHLHVMVIKKYCNAQNSLTILFCPILQKWGREDKMRCSHMI